MRIRKTLRALGVVVVVAIGAGVFLTRDYWMAKLSPPVEPPFEEEPPLVEEPKILKLSAQARKNLGLIAKAARPQTYWRTIHVPGIVTDRPRRSDRGVTSPAVGIAGLQTQTGLLRLDL